MTHKVSTLEVRQRLGDILNRVALRQDEFIVQRKGKTLAAVVPIERLEQMRASARAFGLELLSRPPLRKVSEATANRIANEAKHASRVPQRGKHSA